MKLYRGLRQQGGIAIVYVDNDVLSPSRACKLKNYDWNANFEWGYNGTGPTILALAILLDCLSDEKTALDFYRDFREEFIAFADYRSFIILESQILKWVAQKFASDKGDGNEEENQN